MNEIPVARLDVMRWIQARLKERYNGVMVKVVLNDNTAEQTCDLEIFANDKVITFVVDDREWSNSITLTDAVMNHINLVMEGHAP